MKEESDSSRMIRLSNSAGITGLPTPIKPPVQERPTLGKKMCDCFISYHIPIGLTFLIVWAIIWPAPGIYLKMY